MTEIRKRLLEEFIAIQVFKMPEEEPYLNDECRSVGYDQRTLEDTNLTKEEMKGEMISLRNDGLVELKPCVDYDGRPFGSGWFLTQKRMDYCLENFTKEEIDKII